MTTCSNSCCSSKWNHQSNSTCSSHCTCTWSVHGLLGQKKEETATEKCDKEMGEHVEQLKFYQIHNQREEKPSAHDPLLHTSVCHDGHRVPHNPQWINELNQMNRKGPHFKKLMCTHERARHDFKKWNEDDSSFVRVLKEQQNLHFRTMEELGLITFEQALLGRDNQKISNKISRNVWIGDAGSVEKTIVDSNGCCCCSSSVVQLLNT